jgi:hypothetical protein
MLVEIDVPNAQFELRPGMQGNATVHLPSGPADALRVPITALASSPGTLYVVKGGKAVVVEPKFGYRSAAMIEVLSGLGPDDLVVTNPSVLSGRGSGVPVEVKREPPPK